MKKRIWELDALRGLCVLGMIIVHFIFDLVDGYGLVSWEYPGIVLFLFEWGGILFLLISGACATLGSRSVRRGLIVFGCGMLCTIVTQTMVNMDMLSRWMVIRFGVLHCLGLCMILWLLFKRLPAAVLAVLGIGFIALGFYFASLTVSTRWLYPLGLMYPGFSSGDYFPLFPNLGYFLIGAVIGRSLYRKKESLLPRVNANNPVLRFLQFCGKHSLWIYLLHQPVLTGLFEILSLFTLSGGTS